MSEVQPGVALPGFSERRGIRGLELVVNGDYSARVRELEGCARGSAKDAGNPFFRALQILARLRT